MRSGRRWASEGDTLETKDDSARFKTPAVCPLISPTPTHGRASRTGAASEQQRAMFTSSHSPKSSREGSVGRGCATAKRHAGGAGSLLPNRSNAIPAGSFTDQTRALQLDPSSRSSHSHGAISKSTLNPIRGLLHWRCAWRLPLAKRARDDVTTILRGSSSRHRIVRVLVSLRFLMALPRPLIIAATKRQHCHSAPLTRRPHSSLPFTFEVLPSRVEALLHQATHRTFARRQAPSN